METCQLRNSDVLLGQYCAVESGLSTSASHPVSCPALLQAQGPLEPAYDHCGFVKRPALCSTEDILAKG